MRDEGRVAKPSAVFFREPGFRSKHLGHTSRAFVEQVESAPLFANNSDNPSLRLSLNDSSDAERVKSELITDEENNHGRRSQGGNARDVSPSSPSSFSQHHGSLVDCGSISGCLHQRPGAVQRGYFGVGGVALQPTGGQACVLPAKLPTWLATM